MELERKTAKDQPGKKGKGRRERVKDVRRCCAFRLGHDNQPEEGEFSDDEREGEEEETKKGSGWRERTSEAKQ